MFRPVRWRSHDKNKIKVVFKFQFHATQVTQVNVESLIVSVVPGEVGKPTGGRSEKATIRDGNCKWEYPVYETVKFNQDSKTGKISERTYHFILSTGSAKGSSVVGEASIDLAAYAETAKASNVSLPLKNSKTNGVLHVSIQKLQASVAVDQREEEENEATNIKPRNTTLNTLFTNDENGEGIKSFTNGDVLSATNNNAEPNGVVSTAISGSDVTLTSSGSSSGLNTPRDSQLTSNGTLQDHASTLASKTVALAPGGHQQQPQYEWSVDSDHGLSIDGSTNSSNTGERSQQSSSDVEVEKLKAELVTMARQLDLSDLELQTLRKQVVKESKRGHDLSRELKQIHAECEQLRGMQKGMEEAKVEKNKLRKSDQGVGGDPWLLIGEIRQELYYEKDRNANLQLQLQKTQESNAELLLALKELDEMLAQKGTTTETTNASKSGSSDDEEQQALEEIVKQHSDSKETYMLEQRIIDLGSEIEIYRREKDELEMQMEQLALDYEILKQENHDISYRLEQSQLQEQLNMQYECSSPPTANGRNSLESEIERLEDELKEQGVEYSISLDTIKELQNHIKIVEGELDSERERMSRHPAIVEELEGRIESLENELSKQRKAYSGSVVTINELRNNIKSLEGEIKLQEQSALQHEASAAANTKELKSEIERLENEVNEQRNEYNGSLAIISGLQNHIKTLEEEMKMQEESILDHEASAAADTKELKSEIERLENEKIGSLATISELQNHIKSLEGKIKTEEENIKQHEASAAANTKELESEIERLEKEIEEQGNEKIGSLATISELQIHIKSLEEELKLQEQSTKRLQNEFKKQQKQNSTSLATIKELETHISSMEDELERQSQAFESDLETITRERVEQEQRAIRAEEALKLTRWKNSNTAEKLQEEFKRLSKQMASTFEANENVAMKAIAEANEVRIQKIQLEDMLRRAKSELQSIKDEYDQKLLELTNQLDLKSRQVEEVLGGTSNQKVQKLQAEIEKLAKENNLFSIQVEEMKASIKSHEELENSIAILKKEAEKSAEGLRKTRSIKDAEVERLQCQCDDLKQSLIEDETEKEKLRMQLVCLKGDLKKKDEALISAEKKVKESNRRALIAPRNNKSAAALVSNGTKEVSNLKEKIKLLEMQIRSKEAALETSASSFMHKERDLMDKIDELEERVDELNQKLNANSTNDEKDFNAEELVRELVSLKERNEEMGSELLEMQERYSEISLKFAEVEGERQKLVMTVRSLKNARKDLKQ